MNLSSGHTAFPRGKHTNSGAGGTLGGAANAGPAPLTVGAVGFGPNWTTEDSMAASIIRLECENDELRAEVALLREEQAILKRQFAGVIEGRAGDIPGRSDLSPRTTLEETVQEFREGLFFGEASK
jgi:hypothetical protein